MSTVKTRFAPSPTGRMHVGNLRTALYAYLIAKHEGGKFMLRIEDTDQERFMEGALDIIYRTLAKTGLVHDEGPDKDGGVGPYVQSERQAQGLYMKYAKKLIEQGDAYYCFCDKERLESLKTEVAGKEITVYDKHCLHLSKEEIEANLAAGKPYVIRINMPTEGTTTFHDELYGDITVENNELDDMILIKSDGYPTYNFANVIDDHLMGITHVVRGNEYLSSAPKYNRLYEAFGWEPTTFVHLPNILNKEKKKLSKRHGDVAVEDFKKKGYLPEGLVNYVALVGWSPEDNQEIFSMEELENAFSIDRVSKSGGVFDTEKLNWVNQHYMKDADDAMLTDLAIPFLVEAGFITEEEAETKYEFIKGMVSVLKEKLQYVKEITEHANIFFGDTVELETEECREFLNLEHIPTLIDALEAKVEAAEVVDEAFVKAMFKEIQKEHGIKGKNLFMGSRIILTGQMHGPDLPKTMEVLGKETCLNRIKYVKNNVL